MYGVSQASMNWRADGMACEEYNRLHPLTEDTKEAWISQVVA